MQKQYLGALPQCDLDEFGDQLWDYCNNTGSGIMGLNPENVDEECYDFCASQYQRFGIPLPPKSVIGRGAFASFYLLDGHDPYLLLSGISDVVWTDEWSQNAYEVLDFNNKYWEVDIGSITSFKHIPGNDDLNFNDIMSKPGLDALPFNYYADDLRELLFSGDFMEDIPQEDIDYLRNLCTVDGKFSKDKFNAYFELSSWAAVAWLIGPLGRDFRCYFHDIFFSAIKHGECILVGGEVMSPDRYRKLPRPPKSCCRCGVSAWCVDLISSDYSSSSYMCEHCLSAGMPPSAMATCGTKLCHLTKCAHHPYHYIEGNAGIYRSMRDFGRLGWAGSAGELPPGSDLGHRGQGL